MILTALWDLHPIDPETGEALTLEALAEALEGETTPRAIVTDLVTPPALPENAAVAATKLISLRDRQDLLALLTPSSDLASLLLDEAMLDHLQRDDVDGFLDLRATALHHYLTGFLDARTAWRQEDTPPLTDFVFDG